MVEPMFVSIPNAKATWGKESATAASLLDITPTVLDWYDITYPNYTLFMAGSVQLTGMSLLDVVLEAKEINRTVFASHDLHEITMYYPQRVLRNSRYRLIHNLNFKMPFPIDQDFFVSPTYQDLLNRTLAGQPTHWYRTLQDYYYRPQWQLFDLQTDKEELHNLASDPEHAGVFKELKAELLDWQIHTDDPWRCSPGGILERSGVYPKTGVCLSMHNGLD